MTAVTLKWRPPPRIRVVAVGIPLRGDQILVFKVWADDGTLKGVRPLGGAVEFTETALVALRREFREELGCDIEIEGSATVLENLFTHEGAPGHEIVFCYPITLLDKTLYERDRWRIDEGKVTNELEWIDLARLAAGEIALFPVGLIEALASGK